MLIVGGGIPPSPPRIFNGGGDAHRVKGDAHPPLPYEHPSPPYVPVTPYEQLKFPRVINPDSPLNDSRQLDWLDPPSPNVGIPKEKKKCLFCILGYPKHCIYFFMKKVQLFFGDFYM